MPRASVRILRPLSLSEFLNACDIHSGFHRVRAPSSSSMLFHGPGNRKYEDAIKIIDSRRRQSRPNHTANPEERAKSMPLNNGTPDLKGTPSITGMREWLQMLGYTIQDIDALNIIHVAGTKGKGSTCAFTESFLRAHGQRIGYPRKTGMYTSPHLILPEERIRINSGPLDRSLFAKYFFEIYDKLPQLALPFDASKPVFERGPRFLQLYALLAIHVFIREEVDVTILETHNGGEYDATNIVQSPVVAAITTLGMDHVDMLGPSIENIAWHKSGIYKPGALLLSTVQDRAPAQVLGERAQDIGQNVRFIDIDQRLPLGSVPLRPSVQKKNASLALAVADAFLTAKRPSTTGSLTNEDIGTGVECWSWPGRFEVIPGPRCTWFLDAAHNEMSVEIAAKWFAEVGAELDQSATRVLVFSHISELRDAMALLRSLATALREACIEIPHVIFTTYDDSEISGSAALAKELHAYHHVWKDIFPDSTMWEEITVPGAIRHVKRLSHESSKPMQVLVTGSQYLVGPALRILQDG